ncbi:hypothetical protein GQ54DRAFT_246219, partial [Martensiomyces pterosporus]
KFRVLCLHGYTQNAQKFRDRTGPFRRALKRSLDLVYITAPIQATEFQDDEPAPEEAGAGEPEISSAAWWNRKDGRVWQEIQQSTRYIHRVMAEQGPFDAVMGFSQGSGMAAILAALIQAAHSAEDQIDGIEDQELKALVRELKDVPALKFAIMFAGFYPDLPQFDELVGRTGKVAVPSLHLVGEKDAIVPMDRGRRLAEEAFVGAQVMVHEGGHFVPCNAAWRKKYQAFLEEL